MTTPVFKFCIHRTLDDQELFVGMPDALEVVTAAAMDAYLALPFYKRFLPRYASRAVAEAVYGSLSQAIEQLRDQTVRM